MIKNIFAFIILVHGLIHLMGFAKSFDYGHMTQLTKEIPKPLGIIWLIVAALFVATTIMLIAKNESWPLTALIAVVVSQVLVITTWQDAKFGTVANVIILIVAVFTLTAQHFESRFKADVKMHLEGSNTKDADLLTAADIQSWPLPVQRYLRYAKVVGKAKVKNVKILFDGEMRGREKDWFKFSSVQYNFFDQPTRLFFMKAQMFGITVPGYHKYQDETATMDIRLFGLFPVVQAKGPEMNLAETVTLFNDMCIMVPATLIDKRIEWEAIDSTSARGIFTNGAHKISAVLYFNEAGQLVNFISDDRYDVNDMKQYRFSTPMKDYKTFNDINVPGYGEAIWHYPDGDFVYGKFLLRNLAYNIRDLD